MRELLEGTPEAEGDGTPVTEAKREHSLLDLAYDAVFERSFDTDEIVLWNRSAEALYGWTAADAFGRSPHTLLRTIFPAPIEQIKEELLRTGRWEGELIHTTRTGEQVVVTSRWAVFHEGTRPVSILEFNTDVTENRRAEAERAQLAAIVNSSSDAVIGKTLDGIITSWNPAAEDLYGYAASEVVGRSIGVIFPADRPSELQEILSVVRAGEPIKHYETERVRKDGVRLHVSVSVSPIRARNGTVIGAATIARDITEQKRAEEERALLLEREREARATAEWAQRRLSFLAEASSVLSSSLDYETTLANVARMAVPHIADWCSVNIVDDEGKARRLAVMHNNPEKIELALELERRFPPDPDSATGSAAVIRTGESRLVPYITEEMIAQGAQSDEHAKLVRDLGLVSFMIVPLIARERVFGVITLATAESGKHYNEDDLALAEDLAWRAGTAVDNARLYQEVQDTLRLREEFLSIASHELKTPLTALQLQAQLLRRFVERNQLVISNEMGERVIQAVERQVKRLSRLTNDLLDVSRIASGRFELNREDVDLLHLVREVAARFTEELAAADCRLTVEGEPGVVGRWDRHRLDQVISNLLANAIKYGRGNPIKITVSAYGDVARVEIVDEGIGIEEQYLSRIFDRYERVETSEASGGLGLGLYIVREILLAHGGTVRVESEAGTGSRFLVTLPL